MPDYRRYFVSGGTYFFTVVTDRRRPFLVEEPARKCLGDAIRKIQRDWPFEMPAIVLLPDHLHTIWCLPPGDADYETRWRLIKSTFTRTYLASGGQEARRSSSRVARKERGLWQRRFWEHTIRDEHDFERHFDYIHYNPVKHRHAKSPIEWPHSSFYRWVECGVYDHQWGRSEMKFDDLSNSAME